MPGARVQPAQLKVQLSKLKILHVSNFQSFVRMTASQRAS